MAGLFGLLPTRPTESAIAADYAEESGHAATAAAMRSGLDLLPQTEADVSGSGSGSGYGSGSGSGDGSGYGDGDGSG